MTVSPLVNEPVAYPIGTVVSPLEAEALSFPLGEIVSALASEALSYPLDPVESAVIEEVLAFVMANYRVLRQTPGRAYPTVVDDSGIAAALLPVIEGDAGSFPARLVHTDPYAVSLQIGGGSALEMVTIGTGNPVGDLVFKARGQTIPFSDANDAALVGFVATSIIGALNEARQAASAIAVDYTNSGSALNEGELVYQVASINRTVARAVATSNTIAARVLGAVSEGGIGVTPAAGRVVTDGRTSVVMEAGLTVAVGDQVFLSAATAGRGTNAAPSTSGNVVSLVGFVVDLLTYNGSTDLLVQVQIVRGTPVVVA